MVKTGNVKSNGALLSTREVLIEHLHAKLLNYPECPISHEVFVSKLTNEEILKLLQEPDKLRDKIKVISDFQTARDEKLDKEIIGEKLFLKVAEIDTALCAQITGMLLEADLSAVQELLKDQDKLIAAASHAKSEYLKYTIGTQINREEIGEKIFGIVSEDYPKHAAKITGMLLELHPSELMLLLKNSKTQLRKRIEEAHSALLNQS